MDRVACLAARDRSDLFSAAADMKRVSVQVIEKDFWVCWVLRHLGTLPDPSVPILFKGGTSLSKVFGIIDRMSEDIDLVIDRAGLGYTGERDPTRVDLSGKARERLIESLKADAAHFVRGPLLGALQRRFIEVLGDTGTWTLTASLADPDNATIMFRYPTLESPSLYLRPMVLLELGARGDTWPEVAGIVRPYAADYFPRQFEQPEAAVRAITAGRTFWEKATYLHALAHQDPKKVSAARPARHYFDLFRLLHHDLGREALADRTLLADVVRHKQVFYKQPSARYELATPGTFRLVPPAETVAILRPEYQQMAEEMVFGVAPDLDEVMDLLTQAEVTLNARTSEG